jgi:HAD superfamily hydrolase (TIGR01509 family)
MVQAIVFDLDGVLIDSEPVWLQVRREVVAEFGGRWSDEADHRLLGMNTAEWSAYLADELGVRLPARRVAEVVIDRMAQRYRDHLPVIDGAPETVTALREAGFPLALASSSPSRLITTAVDALGVAAAFDALVSSDEVAHGKPAPDVYRTAVQRLGADPDVTAAVEDSPNGMLAAVAAGLTLIAVPGASARDAVPSGGHVLFSVRELTPAFVRSLR